MLQIYMARQNYQSFHDVCYSIFWSNNFYFLCKIKTIWGKFEMHIPTQQTIAVKSKLEDFKIKLYIKWDLSCFHAGIIHIYLLQGALVAEVFIRIVCTMYFFHTLKLSKYDCNMKLGYKDNVIPRRVQNTVFP